jgi:hypothetical protein
VVVSPLASAPGDVFYELISTPRSAATILLVAKAVTRNLGEA